MFPFTLHAAADRAVPGRVFCFELKRAGGMFASDRRVAANLAEWDGCQTCPEFESCYRLGMGKFAMEAAIA